MQTGAWVADPALAASTGYKGARTRTMSYVKPLRIPLPMAPKQCGVVEVSEMHAWLPCKHACRPSSVA